MFKPELSAPSEIASVNGSAPTNSQLIAIILESPIDVGKKLGLLRERLLNNESFRYLAAMYYQEYASRNPNVRIKPALLVLVAENGIELLREIELAEKHFTSKGLQASWKSVGGSSYVPERRNIQKKVALLFPPSGSESPAKIQELTRLFPDLSTTAEAYIGQGLVRRLSTQAAVISLSLLRDRFAISPDAVIGFSIGEIDMAIATGLIRFDSKKKSNPLSSQVDDLLNYFGKNVLLGKHFLGQEIEWSSYYLQLQYNGLIDLRRKLERTENVYITIVGNDDSVIIVGEGERCRQVIEDLGCHFKKIEESGCAHTPIMAAYRNEIKSLMAALPITLTEKSLCNIYSTFSCDAVSRNFDSYLEEIVDSLCFPVDMQAILLKAEADGICCFIDTSNDNFCATIAQKVLAGTDSVVESLFSTGKSVDRSLLSMLATLISHGVTLDASSLFDLRQLERLPITKKISEQLNANTECKKCSFLDGESQNIESRELENNSIHPNYVSEEPNSNVAEVMDTHMRYLELYAIYQSAICEQEILQFSIGSKDLGVGRNPKCQLASRTIWDYDDILMIASGKLSTIFGILYKEADEYDVRARLPLPPFLFVSRVTDINAKFGVFEPSSLVCEYDIPSNAMYFQHGMCSSVVLDEISHCGILLLNYIGIDIRFRGHGSYRALSASIVHHAPCRLVHGDTLRAHYAIDSCNYFGGQLIIEYSLELYCKNVHILSKNGISGVFLQQDLLKKKDVSESELAHRSEKDKLVSVSLPLSKCSKKYFAETEIEALQDGRADICFDPSFPVGQNQQLYCPLFKMLDRITSVCPQGGATGLGYLESEIDIQRTHWAFDAHFKNDPVFPGNLISAGAVQSILFYLTYIGLRNVLLNQLHEHEHIPELVSESRFLNQVPRRNSTLVYKIEIVGLTVSPVEVIWNYKVFMDDMLVSDHRNAGLRLRSMDFSPGD